MSKDLMQVFNFNAAEVRTIEQSGSIWFVAADIAKVLDFASTKDMTRMLDEDERGTHLVPTLGGMQQMTTINEPGLYAILNKSNKETVKPFQKWVNHEVLPAIRKTGHYATRKHTRPELEATTIFKSYHSIAKLIGLDKNQAALAANTAAKQITGTDTLMLMGATHLLAEVQEHCFTPSELGSRINISGIVMNKRLREAGLQNNINGKWCMTDKGKPYGRLFDTGKKNGGTPLLQLKWYDKVLELVA